MLLAIIDAVPPPDGTFPADVVVEAPALNEKGFSSAFPFAVGRCESSEGAFVGCCFEPNHQGEGFIHRKVLSGERLKSDIAVRHVGIRDFDTFGSGVGGSGEVDESRGIWNMLVGQLSGDFFTRREFDRVVAKLERDVFGRGIIEKKPEVGLRVMFDQVVGCLG